MVPALRKVISTDPAPTDSTPAVSKTNRFAAGSAATTCRELARPDDSVDELEELDDACETGLPLVPGGGGLLSLHAARPRSASSATTTFVPFDMGSGSSRGH